MTSEGEAAEAVLGRCDPVLLSLTLRLAGIAPCDYAIRRLIVGPDVAASEVTGYEVVTRGTPAIEVVRYFRAAFPGEQIYNLDSIQYSDLFTANRWKIPSEAAAVVIAMKFG